jgi:CRP-like cAMP-binding protein
MTSQQGSLPREENRILAAIPKRDFQKVSRKSQLVSLPSRHVLFEQGRPIRFVYFPLTAMIALLSVGEEGAKGVEVCMIGNEGVVGLSAFFDSETALGRTVVQLAGTALRIDIKHFRDAVNPGGQLDNILKRYMQVQLLSVSRSAFCLNFHKLEARLARLLLLTHDSARADTFPMTHEFAAYLLGSHRPAISTAAHSLQAAGLITYRQGKITILDRQGLQSVACECYAHVMGEYERLLGELIS